MKTKKSSTLHRCTLLTKRPTEDAWYHCGPSRVRTSPDPMMNTRAAIVATPKT